MQYSIKLKKAMKEIKNILEKNNIAGFVVLHTAEPNGKNEVEGFSEFTVNLHQPSYSALDLNANGNGYRVKGKSSYYKDKQERDFKMAATQNMLSHITEVAGNLLLGIMRVEDSINAGFGKADHKPGESSSEAEQNN